MIVSEQKSYIDTIANKKIIARRKKTVLETRSRNTTWQNNRLHKPTQSKKR